MRLFLFLALLSSPAWTQINIGNGVVSCDETTNYGAAGDTECADLHINGALTQPLGTEAIVIRVRGDVLIENGGNIILDGAAGTPYNTGNADTVGGAGGPGALGNGGGLNTFATTDATDTLASAALGKTPVFNVGSCAGGGGGAFADVGIDGPPCTVNDAFAGEGGDIVSSSHFAFTDALFRGGFGGGAGGEGAGEFGLGGGGGGAIRIVAGGNITINVNITANGGVGGDTNAAGVGGGGGAGSGGAIWLQSLGNITISGTLNANGGTNTAGNQPNANARGGNGGRGFVRLEDADGSATVTGSIPAYTEQIAISSSSSSSSTSLKSDIACGTIGDDDSMGPSLFIGLSGSIFLIAAARILSRARRKRAKKLVPQNSIRIVG